MNISKSQVLWIKHFCEKEFGVENLKYFSLNGKAFEFTVNAMDLVIDVETLDVYRETKKVQPLSGVEMEVLVQDKITKMIGFQLKKKTAIFIEDGIEKVWRVS